MTLIWAEPEASFAASQRRHAGSGGSSLLDGRCLSGPCGGDGSGSRHSAAEAPGTARSSSGPGAMHALAKLTIAAQAGRGAHEDETDEELPPTDPTRQAQLDQYCVGAQPGVGPTRRPFSPRESQRLSAVQWAARSTMSQAYLALGRGDRYVGTIAQRVFHTPVDPGHASARVAAIRRKLDSVPIEAATCADPDCYRGGIMAYVTDDLSTMVLCPRTFTTSPGEMRRTLIHEAGHAAGIDASVTGNEEYCTETPSVDCNDPCGNLAGDSTSNVDAWAHFIECAASA